MSDGIGLREALLGLAEPLLGLDGFRVLEEHKTTDEVVVTVETRGATGWRRASLVVHVWRPHDRMPVEVRDLPCFGRPARLVCRHGWCGASDGGVAASHACQAKTWTDQSDHFDAERSITRRAGMEACRQVGELGGGPVAKVADELEACWWTVMDTVVEHGTPLVDDPVSVRDGVVGVVRGVWWLSGRWVRCTCSSNGWAVARWVRCGAATTV